MPVALELLAPAKNKDIGIAAIDCGADAVYIAGPAFGAREAAGNPVSDIRELVSYAHLFGAKVYVTLNTILFETELAQAQNLVNELFDAEVDALIVQDLSLLEMNLPPIELHASTQCAIRTPEQAKMLEQAGFKRLVLERHLSLDEIKKIREATNCELEFFVHGAVCVCYSGRCYLSSYLAGRSANRGACIQACRSKYDLVDSSGKIIARNEALLSVKDLRLDSHLGNLADEGIVSFKIEGRLKNKTYVQNIVRHYRNVMDGVIAASDGKYCKASAGTLHGGFSPNPDITFNRGYTTLYISGRKDKWNSGAASAYLGEKIATVKECIGANRIRISGGAQVANGDGLAFVINKEVSGMRAYGCNGYIITIKDNSALKPGTAVYRNFNSAFEKELENNVPRRLVDVRVQFSSKGIKAICDDLGKEAYLPIKQEFPKAEKSGAAIVGIMKSIGKSALCYNFRVESIDEEDVRFYPASVLNGFRRELAEMLSAIPYQRRLREAVKGIKSVCDWTQPDDTRLLNCSNSLSENFYKELGVTNLRPAYEIEQGGGMELMRTRYCIRKELGLCGKKINEPWALLNNGRRLTLKFDCRNCEMVVTL